MHSGKNFKILARKKKCIFETFRAETFQFLQSESQENLFLGLTGCEINFFPIFRTCKQKFMRLLGHEILNFGKF